MLSTGSPIIDAVISVGLALGLFGGLFVLALVCWGWRIPNQKVIAIRVEIEGRSIEEVFEAIQNVEEFPKWLPHVQRVRSIPPGRLPKGAMAAYIVQEDGGAVMMMDHTISSPMLLKRSFADKGLKCVWTYRLVTSKSGNVLVALEERTFLESALQRGLLALLQPKIDMAIKEHLYFLKTGPCGDRKVGSPEGVGVAKAGTGSLEHLDRVDESASELRKRRPVEGRHQDTDGQQHGTSTGSAEQQSASSSRMKGPESTHHRLDQAPLNGPEGADDEADTGGKATEQTSEEMTQGQRRGRSRSPGE